MSNVCTHSIYSSVDGPVISNMIKLVNISSVGRGRCRKLMSMCTEYIDILLFMQLRERMGRRSERQSHQLILHSRNISCDGIRTLLLSLIFSFLNILQFHFVVDSRSKKSFQSYIHELTNGESQTRALFVARPRATEETN